MESTPTIFDYADWAKGMTSFDAVFMDRENKVFAEAPEHPLYPLSGQLSKMKLLNTLIGRYSYKLTGMLSPNVIIGRYTSISYGTSVGATHHRTDYLSTGGIEYESIYYKDHPEPVAAPEPIEYTIIGCDVWIGVYALVLGGAKIGHGAVVGAGSVVKKEIPPYAIAVGNPARVIKMRFPDEVIADLMDLRWWMLPSDIVKTLPYKDVHECIRRLKDIRKTNPLSP